MITDGHYLSFETQLIDNPAVVVLFHCRSANCIIYQCIAAFISKKGFYWLEEVCQR